MPGLLGMGLDSQLDHGTPQDLPDLRGERLGVSDPGWLLLAAFAFAFLAGWLLRDAQGGDR